MLRDFAFYVWKFANNNLKSSFMKQIFELKETNRNVREKHRLDLNISNYNQANLVKRV